MSIHRQKRRHHHYRTTVDFANFSNVTMSKVNYAEINKVVERLLDGLAIDYTKTIKVPNDETIITSYKVLIED